MPIKYEKLNVRNLKDFVDNHNIEITVRQFKPYGCQEAFLASSFAEISDRGMLRSVCGVGTTDDEALSELAAKWSGVVLKHGEEYIEVPILIWGAE